MRKYILSMAIAAALATPAMAEDYTPKDAISKFKKFENVALIEQDGNSNDAGVSQYGWNTLSATRQRGNENLDGGVQINNTDGYQIRLIDQNGYKNKVMTFQEMGAHPRCPHCRPYKDYGEKQIIGIKQNGNYNKASVMQTKMIPSVNMRGHYVKKVGGYVDATKSFDVHGGKQGAHYKPRH